MNYAQSREYISDISSYGSVLGLDTMRELMYRLDNPQNKVNCIHVAGTNGKGSIIAYLSEIYKEAGYKVGRYVSPTLLKYRERIQINHRFIEKDAFADIITQIKEICEAMVVDGFAHPTVFEVETAVAFLYFAQKECDIAIIETGLGGRLDATNVIESPLCCVFASISRDHMGFLGETIGEIALEKAGIIMPGTIAVSSTQTKQVQDILQEVCNEKNVPLYISDIEDSKVISHNECGRCFHYKEYQNLEISLSGAVQVKNAITAIETVQVLQDKYPVSEESMRIALKNTHWFGRMTKVCDTPVIYVDGAHNEDASLQLANTLDEDFKEKSIVAVIGMFADKEYEKVLANTLSYMSSVITLTIPDNPRALHASELAKVALKYHNSVTEATSVKEALEMACLLCGDDGIILAYGSLSYIGEFATLSETIAKKQDIKL